ncbi:MAG: restriction endonuclease [Prevotellaceae bacterium]|jgi:hypothetical protein|nr:restriction endonuclease [Prevotellaceae bacterium]
MNNSSINIQGNIISSEIIEKIRSEESGYFQQPSFFNAAHSVRDEIGNAWINAKSLWAIFKTKRERLKDDHSGTTETRKSWMEPFLAELNYAATKSPVYQHEESGKKFEISHRDEEIGHFPIHLVSFKQSLDKSAKEGKSSPHALVQEYLNSVEQAYALVSNGIFLRLLRDSSRIVRISYYEFNLEKMMEEDLFADFAILYRTLHASRFINKEDLQDGCIFEYYHLQSLQSGSRMRENLSVAVINALVGYPNGIVLDRHQPFRNQTGLANGFIQHPGNQDLRNDILSGRITANTFYAELLQLIYRFLFLIVTEERDLVYPGTLDEDTFRKKRIYYQYYSIERLRKLAGQLIYVDGNKDDLWEGLKSTFILFENEYYGEKLGIRSLSSGIFASDILGTLSTMRLDNKTLIDTIAGLCYFVNNQTGQTVRVNYSDLDVEEFGSVYEGLLEYSPDFECNRDIIPLFCFKEGTLRAKSGSHYTPEDLCKPLIQHSLEYIIEERLATFGINQSTSLHRLTNGERETAIKKLLSIKVCDVACGSGHLLLSAARRIALEIARLYSNEEQPNPVAMRMAMRMVIKNCIYGVDKNPLAIELCKVALWLEAHNPGEPLNFLDHHIKHGDSIVGLAYQEELMTEIPNEAFKAISGDDKEIAKRYRESNRKGAGSSQELGLFDDKVTKSLREIIKQFDLLSRMPETTSEQVKEKERKYILLSKSPEMQRLKSLADIKTAQFFIPKIAAYEKYLVTNKRYFEYLRGGRIPAELETIDIFITQKNFFHWFLEFPEIFSQGGFDCILGNPPFLGGQKLSGSFGNAYLEYLKYNYQPIGAVDFVTYFFRRIFNLLHPDGFQSLVSTNTIAQGSAREGGLDFICSNGGIINHAVRSMRWPGEAAVEVSLVTIRKGQWNQDIILNKKKVERITPYLDDSEVLGNPYPLKQNAGKSFIGSYVLGMGFVVTTEQAQALIAKDPRNKDVLFPYLNGEDLNNDPEQKPSRWVINFFDWSEEKSRTYPDCFEIVERLVRPERQRWQKDKDGNEIIGTYALRKPLPQKWWIYGEKRPALYETISKVDQVMVVPLVSKYTAIEFAPTNMVFMHKLGIITLNDYSSFSLLSSTIHNIWCWRNSSTLGAGTLNYSTTDCFEPFPFPENFTEKTSYAGKIYKERRDLIIQRTKLGLTKLYNQFHNKLLKNISTDDNNIDNSNFEKKYGKESLYLWKHLGKQFELNLFNDICDDIFELRKLHIDLDNAVLESYGWKDIELIHNFYELEYLPENDRIRFTIQTEARKEIFKRLLLLNHKRHSEEQIINSTTQKTIQGKLNNQSLLFPELT